MVRNACRARAHILFEYECFYCVMFDVIIAALLGILAGCFTGLIPGVHVNLLATATVAAVHTPLAAPFLVSLAITHATLAAIPGVLLGAPEASTALGVLPGHRYLLRGMGYMAVKLTLVGSYFGLLIALALIPVWWRAIGLYPYLVGVMGYLLLGVSAYMIFRDSKRWWALLVYVLSGVLGMVVLWGEASVEPLFPLLSGLFGTSTLLYGLTQTQSLPAQQVRSDIQLKKSPAIQGLFAGTLAGFIASMLPGLGNAQAAILGQHFTRNIGDHGFLILLGALTTVNFSLSLLTWLSLDKARNGAVVAITSLVDPSTQVVAQLFFVALLAASVAVPLCLWLTRVALSVMNRVHYTSLVLGVVALIVLLVLVLTGWRGLIVLIVATGVGLIPAVVRCGRAHAMGCLLLPTATYFL